MKKMINLKINNIPVTVPEGTTVLQAAKSVNIEIPSLCYLKDINCIGACRVCVVEIKGRRGLTAACTYPVEEGLEVLTNTATVRASRKTTIELILSTHHKKCLSCVRGNHCELQKLAYDYGIDEDHFKDDEPKYEIDDSTPYVVRDNNKCIQCLRCVSTCNNVQGILSIRVWIQRPVSAVDSASFPVLSALCMRRAISTRYGTLSRIPRSRWYSSPLLPSRLRWVNVLTCLREPTWKTRWSRRSECLATSKCSI